MLLIPVDLSTKTIYAYLGTFINSYSSTQKYFNISYEVWLARVLTYYLLSRNRIPTENEAHTYMK